MKLGSARSFSVEEGSRGGGGFFLIKEKKTSSTASFRILSELKSLHLGCQKILHLEVYIIIHASGS
jgi:hypothetical protein